MNIKANQDSVAAPGNVPGASVATPILNIPSAPSSEPQRSINPVTLASETTSVTTNQTRTTVNVAQSNQQMVKAVIRPSTSNSSGERSENFGMPILTRETKPQGKAVPMISTNTHSGDSLPFRQILPKNLKSKSQPVISLSSSYGGNMRPMQVKRIKDVKGKTIIIFFTSDCWSHSSQ